MISKSFVKVVIQLLHFELDTLIKRPVILFFHFQRFGALSCMDEHCKSRQRPVLKFDICSVNFSCCGGKSFLNTYCIAMESK